MLSLLPKLMLWIFNVHYFFFSNEEEEGSLLLKGLLLIDDYNFVVSTVVGNISSQIIEVEGLSHLVTESSRNWHSFELMIFKRIYLQVHDGSRFNITNLEVSSGHRGISVEKSPNLIIMFASILCCWIRGKCRDLRILYRIHSHNPRYVGFPRWSIWWLPHFCRGYLSSSCNIGDWLRLLEVWVKGSISDSDVDGR